MGELLPYLPYDSGAMRSVASAVKNQATRLATVGSEVAGAARTVAAGTRRELAARAGLRRAGAGEGCGRGRCERERNECPSHCR